MRTFFVLALGRSGTNFLAALLARDRRGVVRHEPWPGDARLIALRYAGRYDRVLEGLLRERFERLLPPQGGAEFYGEVNSLLRYEAAWLRRRFDPVLLHLVRDVREFVRSAWIRPVYTEYEPDGPILPQDGDPWAERWAEASRLERLCWYWNHTNTFLAGCCDRTVRFEPLLTDYTTFRREVLEPTGLEIDEPTWRDAVGRPTNTSARFRVRRLARQLLIGGAPPARAPLPHWSEWSEADRRACREICGETMTRLGYDWDAEPGRRG